MTGTGYRAVKRLIDITASIILLPLAAPIMLMCMVLIRLGSPGKAVFSQQRTGRNGRQFRMYKLRTMVQNADEMKESLRHLSIVPPPDFKIPNDPRVTRVGKVLRKTSLDELPQLWNVLRGDMSLVGPRPTFVKTDQFRLWHTERLDVRPGITGLWQVRERHGTTFDERQRLDIFYVKNMSLWLDIRILVLTLGAVFTKSGI